MLNTYISIFSTENLPDKTRELGNLWEKFVTESGVLSDKIRKNILDSWKRCQIAEINPLQKRTKFVITDYDLKHLLKESELYHVAKPIIDDVFNKMSGTRYLATLSDQYGRIIYLKGDPYILREAEKMNFATGMDWSEHSAGTNAIGTSIITKSPIQIFSAEHFCQGCHPWTCSAAPITHPFTREVLGAIDLTGLWSDAQPHTLGFAVSIAQVIENQLAQIYMKVNNYLTEVFFRGINKWNTDHVLVLNHTYHVVKSSEILKETLHLSDFDNLAMHDYFHPLINDLKRLPEIGQTVVTTELNGQHYQIQTIKAIQYNGSIGGYMIVLHENKKQLHPLSKRRLLDGPWNEIIGESETFLTALHKCYKASELDVPILLLGESGTGKEKIARSIHDSSKRKNKPFLAINCGAIQKELIGSELFGYESGTFTGGIKDGKKGKFEEANGGTLFLDEIGEMPLDLQIHLLRVLQEKEVTRLGGVRPITVNVRIIGATNKNLYDLCKKGLFREDLFFRLNVVTVDIPPLRARKEDISQLSDYFLNQFKEKYQKDSLSLAKDTLAFFLAHGWPGNIRELQNAIEYAVIFSESPVIKIDNLPIYLIENKMNILANCQEAEISPIHMEEKNLIKQFLEETDWNITEVAKRMKIARSTLYRKIKKYNL